MAQSATPAAFRHLDGCMNSDDPTPCHLLTNGTCRAEHPVGSFGHVNGKAAAVTLVRELNATTGLDTYLAVEYAESGDDLAFTVQLGQGRTLSTLLTAGADIYELHRVDDARLYSAQVTA